MVTRPAAQGVEEILVSDFQSLTPSVATTRNGGIGAATSVRIRGAESDQTVVINVRGV